MLQARQFALSKDEPLIFCGDFNSKPGSIVHWYLDQGHVDGRLAAPWYDTEINKPNHSLAGAVPKQNTASNEGTNGAKTSSSIHEVEEKMGELKLSDPPAVRYILDATLNKLCRWLRILGVDAALETEAEELRRTQFNDLIIFERCKKERRSLVTTSTRLMHRRDCPAGAYCINPSILSKLEMAMVHLFLTHGLVLEPEKFLTRCVVCNGEFMVVTDLTEKRKVLKEYNAPEDLSEGMDVYQCKGCKQGYWWCDRPSSSASRVKNAAAHLFQQCLRAGVSYKGSLGLFSFIDPEYEKAQGWTDPEESDILQQQTYQVVEWLRNDNLTCPFRLKSAYGSQSKDNDNGNKRDGDGKGTGNDKDSDRGELPFTNVTYHFVGTLDYVFYDESKFRVAALLSVPRTFAELDVYSTKNGHLLPSNLWPSDHLMIGASLVLDDVDTEAKSRSIDMPFDMMCGEIGADNGAIPEPLQAETQTHDIRCTCGCVPQIKSLFEMAELRKQARAKKEADTVKC
jgi:uncharacterized protein with PIN domain